MSNKFFSLFSGSDNSSASAVKTLTPEMYAFLQQFPTAVLLLDATGKIVFANPAAAALLRTDVKSLASSRADRLGLTMTQIRSLSDASSSKKMVLDIVNPDAEALSVSVGARPLASTPFIMLTLEDVPLFRQLNAEKAFLASLVDGYPAAVTVQNWAGICLQWNTAAEKLFGYKTAQTLNQSVYGFLPKEVVQSVRRMDEELRSGAQPQEGVRLTYKNAKGEERVLSVSKTTLPGPDGKPRFVLSLYEDVTSQHQYEQDLQRNRTLLQAILDNIPLGLYTRDCDSKMTFFNKQSMQVLNECDPKHTDQPHEYQTAEVINSHHQREQQILRDGKACDYPEEVYIDSSGNEKIIHMIKVPLFDAGPKPLVLTIVEDITARCRQEREIRRVNGFLTGILQNAPIGLYARDVNGRMLFRNTVCNSLFGNVTEDAYDENGALPHETAEQVGQYMGREQEILRGGKTLDIPEEEYATANGEKKILHLVKVPVSAGEHSEQYVITLVEDITEKREQERNLMETKNTLQSILEHVPVAIYARTVDDKVSFVNRRSLEMFPGETEYRFEDNFYGEREKSIFKTGKILEFPEETYVTKRGDKLLLHLIKVPVFDKDGKPFMVLTVAEDISEKKKQERAIIDAKNFLETLINQLPVALSVKNYDGKYIVWNKKSEELFGASSADVIGRTSYRSDINKDQAEFLRDADLRVFESRKEQNIPQELVSTASEGVKIMHTVKTPVFNSDGTPNCLLMVSEDITAKTKMEKQIREAGDKNTLLMENAREGFMILDEGKIMYANRAFCRLLGFEEVKDVTGRPLADFVAEDHRMFLKDKYDAVLSGAQNAGGAIELHFMKKKGGEAEAEFAAVSSRYLGRRIVLGFVRDVTGSNRQLRDVKTERESFRAAFEKDVTPAVILSNKGYISVMNEAARKMFGFTEADKNFYRNVYMRPAVKLEARKKLKQGLPAQMDYVFDFARAEAMFPGRISGEGKIPLAVTFVPINKRDSKDGTVEADYVVYLQRKEEEKTPPAPPSGRKPLVKRSTPVPPPPPVLPAGVPETAKEMLVLPNSEPYVLCSADFKIEVCNDMFCSLCQLKEDELKGNDLRAVIAPDSLPVFEEDLKTLTQDGVLSNREYAVTVGSGLETCAVRLTAVKETGGRYLFVFRSLAFHRQIMKILEERSAQLSALLEATDGVVFSILLSGGHFGLIEQANKFLSQKTGFSHDELVHMEFKDLFFDPARDDGSPAAALARAEQELAAQGKTSFRVSVRQKEGDGFAAQVVVTALDLPGKDAALAVVHDLTSQMDQISKDSKEARELKSVREALPGLYLKTDSDGRALEAYSNLDYISNAEAKEIFLDKTPLQFWPEEAASRALFSIKESLSINVSTRFEFEWTVRDVLRRFEVTVTPISGRAEAVLWVKDVSESHVYDEQIRELYRMTREPGVSITDQVDKILAFGQKIFHADAGLVLRFQQGKENRESMVVYVTKNDFHLERQMEFPVEECLVDVADGNVVMLPDLANTSCERCLHKAKGFGSLIAAPLYVGGEVQGALCFASRAPRRSFCQGAEELMGLMAKLLGLRIELRQTGKMLSDASRSLARTLEYVEMPAVMVDLDYQVTYVNKALLETTGRRVHNLLGRDFFAELIRNDDLSKRMFRAAEKACSSNAFQVRMDILHENGLYEDTAWDVFVCKDADGKVDGYALIASSN